MFEPESDVHLWLAKELTSWEENLDRRR